MNGQDRNRSRDESPPMVRDPCVSTSPAPGKMGSPENALGGMSWRDLTEAAGASVRTVRYYISEGLLPPPEGSGPGSAYTPAHLDRLRLIQRLKEAYLPLKEIRRRLSGLDDDGVRKLLIETRFDAGPGGNSS